MAECEGEVEATLIGSIASARAPRRLIWANAPSAGSTPRAKNSSPSQSAPASTETTTTFGEADGVCECTCTVAQNGRTKDRTTSRMTDPVAIRIEISLYGQSSEGSKILS